MKLEFKTDGDESKFVIDETLDVAQLEDEMLLAVFSRLARTTAYRWRERELEPWRKQEIIDLIKNIVTALPDKESISCDKETFAVTI